VEQDKCQHNSIHISSENFNKTNATVSKHGSSAHVCAGRHAQSIHTVSGRVAQTGRRHWSGADLY